VGFSAGIVQANGASIQNSTDEVTQVEGFIDVVGLSANLNLDAAGGQVMVISTFTTATTSGSANNGEWRLRGGTEYSQGVSRWMTNSSDRGIGMVVNIFDFDASVGSTTYALQHSSGLSNNAVITEAGNISMFSLTNYNGGTLDSSQTVEAGPVTGVTTGSQTVAGGTLTLSETGHVFLAASYSTRADTTSKVDGNTGQWQLQIDTLAGDGENWVNVGEGTEQYMSGRDDIGAGMVMGICETDLEAGDYDYQLVASRVSGTAPILTEGITLSAMGLTFSNGQVMPHATASRTGSTSNSTGDFTYVDLQVAVPEGEGVFVGTSFTTGADSPQGATFEGVLTVEKESGEIAVLVSAERTLTNASDVGSTALSVLGELPGSNTDAAKIKFAALNGHGTVSVSNATIVFLGGMDVVPEPATMSLLAIGGIVLLRRKRK
jgi:hypothetical protein